MATAFKCDRCDRYYDVEKCKNPNSIELQIFHPSKGITRRFRPMDLCPTCIREFQSWFETLYLEEE